MRFLNRYFFAGLGSGVLLLAIAIFQSTQDLGKFKDRLVEIKIDQDWVFKSLDGKQLRLSDIQDGKVFLNVWATWCPPCVKEMPSIQRLQEKMKGKDIIFVCVSKEDPKKVREFIKEKGLTLPIYTTSESPPKIFETIGIPATFFISNGKIRFKQVGSTEWDNEYFVFFLQEMLKDS